MPVNKNAYFRYKVIDNCLRNYPHRKYNRELLLEAVSDAVKNELDIEKGISLRTLNYDLEQMQSNPEFNAPIDLDINNNYFYTDPDFSITNCPLVEDDADKLHEALVILKQLAGLPQFEDIENIIRKLEHKSGLKGNPAKHLIEFEQVENSKGTKHIQTIYNSILRERVLKIDYKPFHQEKPDLIIFHPYLLKQFNNRWFTFGFNQDKKSIDTLALDRIEDINPSQEVYIENTFFSAKEYFENIVGVSLPKEKKVEIIQVKIRRPRAQYVLTKPIHHSQNLVKETKSHLFFEWKLISNPELISLLLSFGSDLTLIKPLSFKKEIRKRLINALDNYKK